MVGSGPLAAYQRAALLPRTDLPLSEQLDLTFIPQRGRYADVTSVLNGADHLRAVGDVFVAFADNLNPHHKPPLALAAVAAGQTAVLVRPYRRAEAGHRGVVISGRDGAELVLTDLIEKPSPERARKLEDQHGKSNLWLLEGRARLTRAFVDQLRHAPTDPGTEPKLSLAIRRHATSSGPVRLVITHSAVTDLGKPAVDRLSTVAALAGVAGVSGSRPSLLHRSEAR